MDKSKKKNNNKKTIIIIILIIIYLIIKTVTYINFINSPDYKAATAAIVVDGEYTIKTEELPENSYTTYKNIKFKNVFEDYEFSDNSHDDYIHITYCIKDKNDIKKALVIVSVPSDLVSSLSEGWNYYKELFKRHNIQKDIDLYKYLFKHSKDKISFFMSYKRQKEIFEFKRLIVEQLYDNQTVEEIIGGDYEGYIVDYKDDSNQKHKNFILYKNNNLYSFSFIGDYDEEFYQEVMDSVKIDEALK